MPIHDWTRVSAGIFHHFHHSWIEEIARTLNSGLLPSEYYALSEQIAGNFGPDVLTLKSPQSSDDEARLAVGSMSDGTVAVAEVPPQVQLTAQTEMDSYTRKQSHLTIRHASGDRVVALVEIVSPGNKAGQAPFRKFLEKATSALFEGYHLLILDLLPPGPRDPHGIHGAIWDDIGDGSFQLSPDKPLLLAAYDCGPPITAYIEPVPAGSVLPPMPLFLSPGHYVNVPLEASYQAAYKSVPLRWSKVLES